MSAVRFLRLYRRLRRRHREGRQRQGGRAIVAAASEARYLGLALALLVDQDWHRGPEVAPGRRNSDPFRLSFGSDFGLGYRIYALQRQVVNVYINVYIANKKNTLLYEI